MPTASERLDEIEARYLAEVDSATVFWNASTRFNDGGEFGLGREEAIKVSAAFGGGMGGFGEACGAASGALMVIGLIMAFFLSHRRVWVRVLTAGS